METHSGTLTLNPEAISLRGFSEKKGELYNALFCSGNLCWFAAALFANGQSYLSKGSAQPLLNSSRHP